MGQMFGNWVESAKVKPEFFIKATRDIIAQQRAELQRIQEKNSFVNDMHKSGEKNSNTMEEAWNKYQDEYPAYDAISGNKVIKENLGKRGDFFAKHNEYKGIPSQPLSMREDAENSVQPSLDAAKQIFKQKVPNATDADIENWYNKKYGNNQAGSLVDDKPSRPTGR
jgi:hypothetical protein